MGIMIARQEMPRDISKTTHSFEWLKQLEYHLQFAATLQVNGAHDRIGGRIYDGNGASVRQATRVCGERMPSVKRSRVVRKLCPSAETSNVHFDAVTRRQRTDEPVQRAVQHGVFVPQLSI
jgi:hypothetical protein